MRVSIAFDTSHNEKGNLESSYKNLPKQFSNEKFQLITHKEFPINYEIISTYQILIIAQPTSYLNENEINDLVKFVENGKNLLLLGDAGGDKAHMSNFSALTAQFGVKFNEDKVTDNKNFLGETDVVVIRNLKLHPIFSDNIKEIVYPKGCSLEIISPSLTDPIAWTDEHASPPKKAILVTSKRKFGRVVISGSYLQLLQNAFFFSNIISWLIGEELRIEIKPPTIKFDIPKLLKSSSIESKPVEKEKEIIPTDDESIRNHIKSIFDIIEELKGTQKDLGKYKTFKTRFEFFIKIISRRLNIDLPSTFKQIVAEESTNIAILNKKIKELELKKESSIQLNKYIQNQYNLKVISESEYDNKIKNIKKEIKEIEEQIDLLKSKLRIVEEM